jgi:putative ABC transport system permease protein
VPAFTAEGQDDGQVAGNPTLNLEAVHPTYFGTLGIRIVRGRAFLPSDRGDAPRVAIVSDEVAARAWPGQDPVGRRLKMGRLNSRNEWLTVVGVAASTRYRELATPRPTLYVPAEQFMITAGRLAIRTSMEPSRVADAVRESIHAVDPTVRVSRVAPYADFMRLPLAWPRFNALLLGVFAAAALLLSAIGLYAVIAASVSQRRSEIGVRVALGATASDVRRLVLGEGLRLSAAGVLVGLSVSFVAMRTLRGLLFEVQPLDPATLFGAAVVLLMAALIASYVPARRATRVDAVKMLRAD